MATVYTLITLLFTANAQAPVISIEDFRAVTPEAAAEMCSLRRKEISLRLDRTRNFDGYERVMTACVRRSSAYSMGGGR